MGFFLPVRETQLIYKYIYLSSCFHVTYFIHFTSYTVPAYLSWCKKKLTPNWSLLNSKELHIELYSSPDNNE